MKQHSIGSDRQDELTNEVEQMREEMLLLVAGSSDEETIRNYAPVDVVRYARLRFRHLRLQLLALMTKRGS